MYKISLLTLLLLGFISHATLCIETAPGLEMIGHRFICHFNLKKNLQFVGSSNLAFFPKFQKKDWQQQEIKKGNYIMGIDPVRSMSIQHPLPKEKNGSRAFLESLAFMSVSAALYWWRWGLWAEDWQYELTWDEQKVRFFTFEATKFDSNSFMTNFSHGPNGAIFYNFARTNNLSVGESYLYAFTSSLFWEYVIEFKEIISINDNIFNTFVGFAIGEPLYQLGTYLNNQGETSCRILAAIVNPILALNNWLNRKTNRRNPKKIEHYQHKGSIFFGAVNGDFSGERPSFSHFHLGVESQLISIPGFYTQGKSTIRLKETFFSEISADMMLGPQYIEEFNIYSMATLFGLFKKNLGKSAYQTKKLPGHQYFLALGSAFEIFRKRSLAPYDTITSGSSQSERNSVTLPTEFSDKMAIVNIVGPIFQYWNYTGSTCIQLNIHSYFDFALVNSFALQEFSNFNNLYGIKSTLAKYGYYYAFGLTVASEISITHKNINIVGKMKYHRFESIENLDRFQDSIDDDFHLNDSRFQYQIGLAYSIPHTPIALMLSCERIYRQGTIKDVFCSETEKRIYFQIKLLLF